MFLTLMTQCAMLPTGGGCDENVPGMQDLEVARGILRPPEYERWARRDLQGLPARLRSSQVQPQASCVARRPEALSALPARITARSLRAGCGPIRRPAELLQRLLAGVSALSAQATGSVVRRHRKDKAETPPSGCAAQRSGAAADQSRNPVRLPHETAVRGLRIAGDRSPSRAVREAVGRYPLVLCQAPPRSRARWSLGQRAARGLTCDSINKYGVGREVRLGNPGAGERRSA